MVTTTNSSNDDLPQHVPSDPHTAGTVQVGDADAYAYAAGIEVDSSQQHVVLPHSYPPIRLRQRRYSLLISYTCHPKRHSALRQSGLCGVQKEISIVDAGQTGRSTATMEGFDTIGMGMKEVDDEVGKKMMEGRENGRHVAVALTATGMVVFESAATNVDEPADDAGLKKTVARGCD